MNPTLDTYEELDKAYDYFNQKLFGSALPKCLLTYQRNKNTYGYFCPKRFKNKDGEEIGEIALNPEYFSYRTIEEILSTLVHEQAHVWQEHFGKKGRGGYHNKQWANKMKSIGLIPTDTGKPKGKETGDKMSHYIDREGLFKKQLEQLLNSGFYLEWKDRISEIKQSLIEKGGDINKLNITDNIEILNINKNAKTKYCCPCKNNLWGKAGLRFVCFTCEEEYLEQT